MFISTLLRLTWTCSGVIWASSTFSPARPPAIPLAVRSPYLSCWQAASANGPNLAGTSTTFWTGQKIAWTGLIRVDGINYVWMGAPKLPNLVDQISFEYTSTRSTFMMSVANKVHMNVTFLSPVTPNDLQRQSLPFSYLDVGVASLDGASHDVQLYTDISAEWISFDNDVIAAWQYGVQAADGSPGIAYHQIYRQSQIAFGEHNDTTDYGNWYYGTDNSANLTFQSGFGDDLQDEFNATGKLSNANDTQFRAINDRTPAFGFAIDIGQVESSRSVGTLFSIGLAQTHMAQFDGAGGVAPVPSLWTTYHPSDLAALAFFHTDYLTASGLTSTIDTQVANDARAAGGQDYVTVTTLAYRQAFAATQLGGAQDDPFLFLKEISSDGNMQTVDVIFPFHPILLYSNTILLKYLLEPLFINQEAGHYPNNYSMHDLGAHYPNATGHPAGDDEKQPLEECGNMLIMTLAYAMRANDNTYLTKHYRILDQWTQYLIQESLYPRNEISTDDFAGALANQTNLALKGIIGIQAMSTIANLTGNSNAATNYSNIAHDYIKQWQSLAVNTAANPPHTTLSYGQNDTHGLLYNLYADRLLGLDLVPQEVYDIQSVFYPTINERYGVPLDSRHDWVKNDWHLFAAAIASPMTKATMISDIAIFINETSIYQPLSDLYVGQTAGVQELQFRARPVVGGFFSLLALPK